MSEKNVAQRDGEAELLEEDAHPAFHEAHRHEHGDDGADGGDDGEADFVGGFERGGVGAFAHAHVPDDVLDLDDGVIDQDAGHQRQRDQRHHVEGEAEHFDARRRSGMIESGMAAAAINVARQSRRIRNTTRHASSAPSISAWIELSCMPRMNSTVEEDLADVHFRTLRLDVRAAVRPCGRTPALRWRRASAARRSRRRAGRCSARSSSYRWRRR